MKEFAKRKCVKHRERAKANDATYADAMLYIDAVGDLSPIDFLDFCLENGITPFCSDGNFLKSVEDNPILDKWVKE